MLLRVLPLFFAFLLPVLADCNGHADDLANLFDPVKLATLGPREPNPLTQKADALLDDARRDGRAVFIVATNAVFIASYTNAILAQMTRDSLDRNHGIDTPRQCKNGVPTIIRNTQKSPCGRNFRKLGKH